MPAKGNLGLAINLRVRTMMRFLFASLGFGAPVIAMLVVAGLSWNDGRKERRRPMALRQWLRGQ